MALDPLHELRAALNYHDEWPTQDTSNTVIRAARQLIDVIDARTRIIEYQRAHETPSEQAIRDIMNYPNPPQHQS